MWILSNGQGFEEETDRRPALSQSLGNTGLCRSAMKTSLGQPDARIKRGKAGMANQLRQPPPPHSKTVESGGARATPAAGWGISSPLPATDLAIMAAWFLAAWAVYAGFGLRLARGVYFDYYNLAFDFDPPRY